MNNEYRCLRNCKIKVQQGDLSFISQEPTFKDGEGFNEEVQDCDSHCFDEPVQFAPYNRKKKSNILGYVKLDSDRVLRHPEHDDVEIRAGIYTVRQARSWEANPKGIWTLRID